MKSAISIIIFLIICAMIAETEITFNPFRIQFHQWERLVGYFLFIIALFFLYCSAYKEGCKDGYNRCLDDVMKIIDEKDEKMKSDEHLPSGTKI